MNKCVKDREKRRGRMLKDRVINPIPRPFVRVTSSGAARVTSSGAPRTGTTNTVLP